jgi:hypothetical protein
MEKIAYTYVAVLSLWIGGCGPTSVTPDAGSGIDAGIEMDAEPVDRGGASDEGGDDAGMRPITATMMVGPEGGELVLEGATVSIPPGALAEMTEIKVEHAEDPEPSAPPVTSILTLEPAGLTFAQPIKVTLELTTPLFAEDPLPKGYWSTPDGSFEELPAQLVGEKLVIENTHFSQVFAGVTPFVCSPIPLCAQKQCHCQMAGNLEVLCKTPNTECELEIAWTAPRRDHVCEGYVWNTSQLVKGVTAFCSPLPGQPEECEIKVPRSRYPMAAQHIEDVRGLFADLLTLDRDDERVPRARRRAARASFVARVGRAAIPPNQIDEYPPAMTAEGGANASTREIDGSDNQGAGSCMGNQAGILPDGTSVRIVAVP